MNKIKILHVHVSSILSGSGVNTLLTMGGLNKDKYDVEFACAPGGELVDEVRKHGIKYKPVKHFVDPMSPYNDFIALFELLRIIKKGKYDIVHTHNSKAGFVGRLAAKIAGVRIVIHTIHGFSFNSFEGSLRRNLFVWLERFSAKFTDKLMVVSNPIRERGLALHIGKKEHYLTVHDGVDVERFKSSFNNEIKRKEFNIKRDDLVIGFVSKLWEGKGHVCSLQAFKDIVVEFPNAKLMFVGEGYLKKKLKKKVRRLDLKGSVIFTGLRNDIAELNSIFDIAILPSFFEGLGRSLIEAQAAGKPVVATRVGGIVDVVEDGKTGMLVEPNNPRALKYALIALLQDPQLRKSMGSAGQGRIDKEFSVQNMVKKIEEVYEELLERNS